jgi:hypothetical protein
MKNDCIRHSNPSSEGSRPFFGRGSISLIYRIMDNLKSSLGVISCCRAFFVYSVAMAVPICVCGVQPGALDPGFNPGSGVGAAVPAVKAQ